MPPTNVIKQTVKNSLKNNWSHGLGIGAILLSVFCLHIAVFSVLCSIFSNAFGNITSNIIATIALILIGQFFGMPLIYGVIRYFWFFTQGANIPIKEIFCYFSDGREYLKAISLSFRIFLRIVTILVLCFLPSIILTVIRQPEIYNFFGFEMPYFVSTLWGLTNIFELFGTVLSVVLLLRYFAAPILMINDNNISPQEALHLSVIISKQANGRTLGFLLSFIGWLLLSTLIVPLIYIFPYFLASYAVYCRYLIDNYNNMVSMYNHNCYPRYQPPRY